MTAPAFVTSLAEHGDRVALVDDRGARVTYAELAQRVDTLAETLGDSRRLVMVEVASTIPAVVAYLAALRGDHAVIVAKPGDVAKAGPIIEGFRPSAVHEAGGDGFDVLHDDDPELHDDLAALFSTSGSTGRAKLVRLSGQNIQANADSIAEYLEIDEDEIAPTSLPLSYSYGASILSSHLSRGACLVLTEHSVVDPEFEALLKREKCTSLSGVPHTWKLIEQVGLLGDDLPDLKTLTQAGGKMPASRVSTLAEWARERDKKLVVMYGQTECTARMAYLPWEHTFEHADCIGLPIPGGSFRLVDEDGETIEGADTKGELVYTGPNVMMGYATEREELAASPGPSERFTGDLAERTDAGLFKIVGRLSRFSKIMGLRISLDEVEAMAKREGFDDPVVAGDDSVVAICVVEGKGDAAGLEARVAELCGIPANTVVAVEVDEAPRLHSGKTDYPAVLELAAALAQERESQTQSLREELASLLGADSVADSETFATMGGDSLTYIQASFAIEKRLGYLPDDWESLTFSALEAYESGAGPGAGASTRATDGKASGPVAVDMDVLLRAFAIAFVVFNHTRPTAFPVAPGAMPVLLMAAGQTLARFRSESLFKGESWALVKTTFIRYMLPYLGILVLYLSVKRRLDLPSLFLYSTWVDPRAGTFLEPYWFIEVFFHLAIVMALFFAIPPLRSAVEKRPFHWGVAGFVFLGALHIASNTVPFHLPMLFTWSGIFALGWCVHFARTTPQRVLLSATALAMPWLTPRGYEVAVVLLIVIWLPRAVLFFEPVKTFIGRIASATFQIYILHTLVITAIGFIPGVRGSWIFPVVGVPLSIATGVAFNMLPAWQKLLPGRGADKSSATSEA